MQDELDRSMASLKVENASSPYFLSYLVKDSSSLTITASSGALTANNENRNRSLRIDLRVGDFDFDNSNFTSGSGALASMPPSEASDPDELDFRSLAMSQIQPNPSMFNLTKPAMIYKVLPDGREELVRGAVFGGISINGFKELTATSDEDFVYNFQTSAGGLSAATGLVSLLFGITGMPDMNYPATVITPAFLMPGIDVKKPTGEYKKPPIVSCPGK